MSDDELQGILERALELARRAGLRPDHDRQVRQWIALRVLRRLRERAGDPGP